MTHVDQFHLQDTRAAIAAAIASHRTLFLFEGIVLVALGLIAVALPHVTTIAVEIFVGWLFFIGGVLRVAVLASAKTVPGYWWQLFGAVLAVVLGLVLIAMPLQGVLTLTAVLIALFAAQGVSSIFAALDFRHHTSRWGWLLFSGVVDLILAGLIWQGWPATAAWAIGLLTGVNLFFLGLSLSMLAIAVPRPTTG